ncbi:DUF2332 family protein [Nonomuraea sp. SYSU D8015]|uniref:DUF2332 family protein n=1 Tax=Nonomuraea sp. SYSU D8015 TaxID=2593644 RepID=UPI001CB74C86
MVWPEHAHRRARLRAAAGRRGGRRATVGAGDLVDDLSALAAQPPSGATLMVFQRSVLYQGLYGVQISSGSGRRTSPREQLITMLGQERVDAACRDQLPAGAPHIRPPEAPSQSRASRPSHAIRAACDPW